MKEFVITTDSNSDLLPSYIKEKNIGIISHYYDLEGITYGEDHLLSAKEFYDKMRAGVMPTTMASNPAVIRETFQKYVSEGYDVLHISFSSALSGGCNNVMVGAKEVCEENEGAKIIVIDTLNVSLGQGMVIMKAAAMREQGKSIDEVAAWIEEHKLEFCVQFTVDDLHHLHRGGRVSKATAIVGSMINIKPILVVNNEGQLVSNGTTRGRKKSLATLVDNMLSTMGKYKNENNVICVVHGDVEEDANFLVNLIKEKLHTDDIIVNTVSPSIGAHSGPGAIGICYMGEHR
ncbi:DegV family protein [Lachnoclostridium phytofermentans]|uniref:DegV family protein n=1 Tax=Lachnoclostridium phytofermentans (strain ATCC 700394 / DSM 18823 / ISDg) TaxID=357809 RepID=A9KT66_LACP7|nr:DegV family protein [Lachnoclostridium phytofermentans]ABX43696.1 degV family protein [Lachnoclostridium phytofermentans ISDg]